jgi:hypothetical protein
MAAPTVGINLLILVCKKRLNGTALEVQCDDVTGGERLLREMSEEAFVHDTYACNPNRTFFLPA